MKTIQIPVLVSLVTYNEELFLARCLESLENQTAEICVRIFDNASQDATRDIARKFGVNLYESKKNRGYSFGHNKNLADSNFEIALLLNADVVLSPDYVKILLATLDEIDGVGMVGGKLYRMDEHGEKVFRRGVPILDSTGIFFTPSQRHFDRGSEEEDRGQYDRRQLVFGITGAVLMCRKKMLEDISMEGEYLDEDFFVYREDADLAWRAQLRGWKAVYEPGAKALHCRHVLPSRRRELSQFINYHSLKNRYLMRRKNLDAAVRWRCFPYMWIRDLAILCYVVLFERSSLSAYRDVWRLRQKFFKKRKHLQTLRRVNSRAIADWFSFTPVARDL